MKKPPAATYTPEGLSLPPGVLAVTNERPVIRAMPGRYDAWFDTIKPGDCIRVNVDCTDSVQGYLKRYAIAKGKQWRITRSLVQPDGIGRIWIEVQKAGK